MHISQLSWIHTHRVMRVTKDKTNVTGNDHIQYCCRMASEDSHWFGRDIGIPDADHVVNTTCNQYLTFVAVVMT